MARSGFKTDVAINLKSEPAIGEVNILVLGQSSSYISTEPDRITSKSVLDKMHSAASSDVYSTCVAILDELDGKLPVSGGVNLHAYTVAPPQTGAVARKVELILDQSRIDLTDDVLTVRIHDIELNIDIMKGDRVVDVYGRLLLKMVDLQKSGYLTMVKTI